MIHQRYQLQKFLGNVGDFSFLSGLDELTGQQIYIALTCFDKVPEVLLMYYKNWIKWTQQNHNCVVPVVDFGTLNTELLHGFSKHLILKKSECLFFISAVPQNSNILSELSSIDVADVFYQTLYCMLEIHQHGMLCYDLSPYQILLFHKKVLLLFPGIILPNHMIYSYDVYTAPEVQQQEYHDERCDIFSIGMCFFKWWSSQFHKEKMSEPLAKIVKRCRAENVSDRYQNMVDCLEHCQTSFNKITVLEEPEKKLLYSLEPCFDLSILQTSCFKEKQMAFFFHGKPGSGKTSFLQSVKKFYLDHMIFSFSCYSTHPLQIWHSWFKILGIEWQEEKVEITLPWTELFSWEDRFFQTRRHIIQPIIKKIQQPTILLLDDMHRISKESFLILLYLLQEVQELHIPLKVIGTLSCFPPFWKELEENFSLENFVHVQEIPYKKENYFSNIMAKKLGVEKPPKKFISYLEKQGNLLYADYVLSLWIQKEILFYEEGEWHISTSSLENLPWPKTNQQAFQEYKNFLPQDMQDVLQFFISIGGLVPCTLFFHWLENTNVSWILLWNMFFYHWICFDKAGNVRLANDSLLDFPFPSNNITDFSKYMSDTNLDMYCAKYEQNKTFDTFFRCWGMLYFWGLENVLEEYLEKYVDKIQPRETKESLDIGIISVLLQRYDIASVYLEKLVDHQEWNEYACLWLIKKSLLLKEYTQVELYLKKLKCKKATFIYILQLYGQMCFQIQHQLFIEAKENIDQIGNFVQDFLEQQIHRKDIFSFCCEFFENEFVFYSEFPIHSLLQLCTEKCTYDDVLMKLYTCLGKWQTKNGFFANALESYHYSLRLAQQLSMPSMECVNKLGIVEIYAEMGLWLRSNSFFQQTKQLQNHEKGMQFSAEFLFWKARFLALQEDESTLEVFQEAWKVAQKKCNKNMVIESLFWSINLNLAHSSKNMLKELQDVIKNWGLEKLEVYVCLVESRIQRFQEIENQHIQEKLQKFLQSSHLPKHIAWQIYIELGEWERVLGNLPSAMSYFRKAVSVIESLSKNFSLQLQKEFQQSEKVQKIYNLLDTWTKELPVQNGNIPFHEINIQAPQHTILQQNMKAVFQQQYLEQQEELLRLRKLFEINKQIATEHNLRKLLDLIMDTAIEITRAERGFLILSSTFKDKNFEVARNFEKEDIENPEFEISHSITEEVIRTGLPILASDAMQDKRFESFHSVSELSLHSVLAIPLCVREKILGALYMDNRFEKSIFTDKEKYIVELFADQAAIAIDNARILEENLQKQKELQKSKEQIEILNQKLSTANKALAERVELREEELSEAKELLQRNQYDWESVTHYQNLIGHSKCMQEVFRILDRVADKNIPVFIYGESGTGKELVARAIHFNGNRKDKNFLSENCAALPENLLASELFGHVKGAFTGAVADKKGLFELADGGSLFLDEVGDMHPSMQSTLLRVLENNKIRRVGGKSEIEIDVRIISASNKNLADLVSQNLFREDLFFRLKVVQINLPSLRERKEDIPLLVDHFLEEYAKENNQNIRKVDKKTLAYLSTYSWPGNVRELKNILYNALSIYDDEILLPHHFKDIAAFSNTKNINNLLQQELSVDEYARLFVSQNQTKYNDSQLARILGFSRKTLWEKRKKWGLIK